MPIINKQTAVIHQALAGAIQSFTTSLDLDFDPTSVIVREVSYGNGGNTNDLHSVSVNWVNAKDGIIATFLDDTSFVSNPSSSFKVQEGLVNNGDITIELRRLTNTLIASTAIGELSVVLEFVREEYHETKPVVADMSDLITFLKQEKTAQSIYPFAQVGGEIETKNETTTPSVGITGATGATGVSIEQQPMDFENMVVTDTRNAYDQGEPPIPDIYVGRGLELRHFDIDGKGMTGGSLFGKVWKKVKKGAKKALHSVEHEAEHIGKEIKSGVKDVKNFVKEGDEYLHKPDLFHRLGKDVGSALKKAEDEVIKAGKSIKKSAEAGTLLSDSLDLASELVRKYGDDAAGFMASAMVGPEFGVIAKQLASHIVKGLASKETGNVADYLDGVSKKVKQAGLGYNKKC